jgi:hypothetical protein
MPWYALAVGVLAVDHVDLVTFSLGLALVAGILAASLTFPAAPGMGNVVSLAPADEPALRRDGHPVVGVQRLVDQLLGDVGP